MGEKQRDKRYMKEEERQNGCMGGKRRHRKEWREKDRIGEKKRDG